MDNYNCYLVAVRHNFAIVIILAEQNNAIQLLHIPIILQCMRYIELLPNPNPDVHIIIVSKPVTRGKRNESIPPLSETTDKTCNLILMCIYI